MSIPATSENSLKALVTAVAAKPGLFIFEPSVRRARSFFDGYALALLRVGVQADVAPSLPGYSTWLSETLLQRRLNGNSWEQVLLEVCNSDDLAAFSKFAETLSVYLRTTGDID